MRKKSLFAALALTLVFGMTACGKDTTVETETTPTPTETVSPEATEEPTEEAKEDGVETFAAEYEMKGTTSSGKPKNDTFIFEGTTKDGIITELNFDIIRNKGTENEYSKKDIMGYMMNVSDAEVAKDGDKFKLVKLTAYGFDPAYGEGGNAQYLVSAACDELTETTAFKDLTFTNDATGDGASVELDKALIAFGGIAKEAGVETLTEDTLVKDLLVPHGFYKDNAFVEGSTRVSFEGIAGGRSYGEQIDAIAAHILENNMTLEDVYEMFKTVNQPETSVEDRDVVSGASIAFVGDFQRMVYVAMHGEIFEGVTNHSVNEDITKVEVVTQGYGGEIETFVSFDGTGKIVEISVRDSNETENIGAVLTAEDSDFIKALIDGQENVDGVDMVSGATKTSTALINAVKAAQEYYQGL